MPSEKAIGVPLQITIILVSATVGFVLNEVGHWLRKRATEKKQKNAVRTLIDIENEENVILLEAFLKPIKEFMHKIDFQQERPTYQIGNRAAEREEVDLILLADQWPKLSFPQWSFKALESQLSMIPIAYNKNEIKQILNLRHQLEALSTIHNKILTRHAKEIDGDKSIFNLRENLEKELENADSSDKIKIENKLIDLLHFDSQRFEKYVEELSQLMEEFSQAVKTIIPIHNFPNGINIDFNTK